MFRTWESEKEGSRICKFWNESTYKNCNDSCKKGVEQTEYVDLGVGGWAAIGAVALSVVIGDVFMILPVVPAWW